MAALPEAVRDALVPFRWLRWQQPRKLSEAATETVA
jgi:hypothetical protein